MSKPPTNPAQPDDPASPPRIVLAGWGLVTPLGQGAWPTFSALLAGRTLADRADELPTDTGPADLARALGCVAHVQHGAVDPAVALAESAAREALTMAGVAPAGLPVWLGTSKGAVAKLSLSLSLGKGRPITEELARCVALGPHAYLACELDRRLNTRSAAHFVSACSSSLYALDAARRALLHTRPSGWSEALVVTADAAITPAFVHSYQRLGVLGEVTAASYRQRPLDDRRLGFMVSEIGAAVLLRRLEPGQPMPAGAIELLDTATACEGEDMIRPSESMDALARLWRRLTAGRRIDLIHPHAPGTREHDPRELDVLLQASNAAGGCPDVYAVKGAIGHGLGASGLASLVVAALTLRTGRRPPMPWLTEPMKLPGGRRLETNPSARSCNRGSSQAVLAAGFGGHLAGAILQGHAGSPLG